MRLKLHLSVIATKNNKNEIPINYQYELSSWVYKTLNYGNPEFSEWLHSQGYINENKNFKLFTFSHFDIPTFRINKDRLQILSPKISLTLSFLPIKAIETFVIGLFKNQEFGIGDKQSQADFKVISVERMPEPEFRETIKYRCLSPIFIDKIIDGQKHKSYLSPEQDGYEELFSQNLISKFLAHSNSVSINPSEIKIRYFGKIRKKGITIKANTPEETKIIGYMFNFELKAPPELQRIGYYAGFGRLNSQGFGCCEIV